MLKSTLSGLQRCRWQQYASIFIRLAVVVSEICAIPRNSSKIRTYISSRSSKVIDLGVNRMHICSLLFAINSNYGLISSLTVFEILTNLARNSLISPPHPCLTPPSEGTPCNISAIYSIHRWKVPFSFPIMHIPQSWVMLCMADVHEVQEASDKSFHRPLIGYNFVAIGLSSFF